MPEAVDRLELVADGEQVLALEQAQDLELTAVGVLELVHHHQLEAARPGLADLLAASEQRRREQLEVVEVDRRALELERLIRLREGGQQAVQQRAGCRRRNVARLPLAGCGRARQAWPALAAAAQLGVDRLDHRPQSIGSVGGHQRHRLGVFPADELPQGHLEGVAAQASGDSLVEHPEAGIQARCQRVGCEQPRAEAVDRRDVGGLGVARGRALAELEEGASHALPQLAGGAVGERDREDLRGAQAVLEHGGHEALHQHRRLPLPAAAVSAAAGPSDVGLRELLVGQRHRQIEG